jgi:hypothetical protein
MVEIREETDDTVTDPPNGDAAPRRAPPAGGGNVGLVVGIGCALALSICVCTGISTITPNRFGAVDIATLDGCVRFALHISTRRRTIAGELLCTHTHGR